MGTAKPARAAALIDSVMAREQFGRVLSQMLSQVLADS
jgi:hypothetical protein